TEGPEVHNLRCSNVPVENATALAAVLALGQRLCSDDPALGASLRSAAFAGHLVQMIAPLGGDAPLELGERGFALGSHLRAALASGKLPLPAAQLALSACHPPRALDGLAVAQGDQVRQAEVDAHAIGTGPLHGNNLDMKDDVPLVGLPRQDRAIGRARKLPMPADLHLTAHTHKTKLAGFAQRQPITDTKVGGVIAGTRPEPRALPRAKNALYVLSRRRNTCCCAENDQRASSGA